MRDHREESPVAYKLAAGVVDWLKSLLGGGGRGEDYEVEARVQISSWAEYPDAEKRSDIARCLQLEHIAFTLNPAREQAGFADPMDVRGGDPAYVDGSLGTHVPQWAWDSEINAVPEGEELDRMVEDWMMSQRDQVAERMKVLAEPARRQAANDSRSVESRSPWGLSRGSTA